MGIDPEQDAEYAHEVFRMVQDACTEHKLTMKEAYEALIITNKR